MNVKSLKELLDDFGDHLEVYLMDPGDERFREVDACYSDKTNDGTVVVVIEIGDELEEE